MKELIRPARLEDAERLQSINLAALGYDFSPAGTARRLQSVLARPSDCLLVCEVDGRVAGYIHLADYEAIYCESFKNVLALAVDPAFQGRGLGRMLIEAGEAWAQSCGCAGVQLSSGMDRTGAHAFYRRVGFAHRKDQKSFVKHFA